MKLRPFIPALIIIAVGVWAYHNSFRGPFIFDDLNSIRDNPHIHHWWSIRDAMFVSPYLSIKGRPVESESLALNYALGGLDVRGYHAVNLTLHLACALVLFGLLRRTLSLEQFQSRLNGAATWLAMAITLIWEVHPLQTESVTYIVQRSELLMALFLLLTLYCTLRGSQSARPRGWFLAAAVSCALGMGSKEVMVSAPLIVLLYDRVFLVSSFRELWHRRAALYIDLAATWLVLAIVVARTPHPATRFGIEGLTSWNYLKTEAGVIAYYLRLCFWPYPLVIDYFDWPIARSLKDVLVPGAVIIGLLVATVRAFRRHPWLGFLGAWFFLILAPTSSFLPSLGEVAAERRMYLPSAAVMTLTVVTAFAIGKRLSQGRQGVAFGCVAAGAVVALLSFRTIQRNRDYRSAVSIWQDTVEKRPRNARAQNNLGEVLSEAGQVKEAMDHLELALRLKPDFADAHNNLGNTLIQAGKAQEAISQLQQALRIEPWHAMAHYNLGVALQQTGRAPEAISEFRQALRIEPWHAMIHYNLGVALQQAGRASEAISEYEEVLKLQPDYADAHNNLGAALMGESRLPEAIIHYQQALRIHPGNTSALVNLGLASIRLGNIEEGIGYYQQALRIDPNLAEAHYNLGLALEKLGRTPEAIQHYQQALRIKPGFIKAQQALARALAVM